ncbi:MAG: hypothetical protein EPO21_03865 [Chloroflexota bacterium]|nr:MAG: hypothetical protein EPO21_03865 [Chloroflexota bacterium]
MRGDVGDTLYYTWQRDWRPKASRPQVVLSVSLAALAMGAVALHWLLVLSPMRSADLAKLNLPYEPWYLAEKPPAVAREVGEEEAPKTTGGVGRGTPEALPKKPLVSRPNLVPQSGAWDTSRLGQVLLSYLDRERQTLGEVPYAPSPEANRTAQELAERYAAGGAQAIQDLFEESLLAHGWLWEVWRGCESPIYLSFPDSQIEKMGCAPKVLPAGRELGIGVAPWTASSGEPVPVFALVWRGENQEGEAR